MRVLIVEDEKRLAATLQDLLEMDGYTADVSYDGESGLDKLAEELDLPILGRMPIDPKLAELASGEFAKANNEYLAAAESLLIALEG